MAAHVFVPAVHDARNPVLAGRTHLLDHQLGVPGELTRGGRQVFMKQGGAGAQRVG